MDFKIMGPTGNLVALVYSACEARTKMRSGIAGQHVLLDDTGIEISGADLEVLCAVEQRHA